MSPLLVKTFFVATGVLQFLAVASAATSLLWLLFTRSQAGRSGALRVALLPPVFYFASVLTFAGGLMGFRGRNVPPESYALWKKLREVLVDEGLGVSLLAFGALFLLCLYVANLVSRSRLRNLDPVHLDEV